MGQTIHSVPHMIAYAGDLRRQARQAAAPDMAEKLQRSAVQLEHAALTQVGQNTPRIARLLDLIV